MPNTEDTAGPTARSQQDDVVVPGPITVNCTRGVDGVGLAQPDECDGNAEAVGVGTSALMNVASELSPYGLDATARGIPSRDASPRLSQAMNHQTTNKPFTYANDVLEHWDQNFGLFSLNPNLSRL